MHKHATQDSTLLRHMQKGSLFPQESSGYATETMWRLLDVARLLGVCVYFSPGIKNCKYYVRTGVLVVSDHFPRQCSPEKEIARELVCIAKFKQRQSLAEYFVERETLKLLEFVKSAEYPNGK